jgi:hypothetical protein
MKHWVSDQDQHEMAFLVPVLQEAAQDEDQGADWIKERLEVAWRKKYSASHKNHVFHIVAWVVIATAAPVAAVFVGGTTVTSGSPGWVRAIAAVATLVTIVATALERAFRWGQKWLINHQAAKELRTASWEFATEQGNFPSFRQKIEKILASYDDAYVENVLAPTLSSSSQGGGGSGTA